MMPFGAIILVNVIYRCDYTGMIIAVIIALVGCFFAKNFTVG